MEVQRLTSSDVIEYARRSIEGRHMMFDGHVIPAVTPATMNV